MSGGTFHAHGNGGRKEKAAVSESAHSGRLLYGKAAPRKTGASAPSDAGQPELPVAGRTAFHWDSDGFPAFTERSFCDGS